jgi:paraquat-inducible protein B
MVGIVVVFGSGALFRDTKRFVIFFTDSLEGLSVGAPVKYRGVQIGSVVDIRPVFREERVAVEIPVVIELDSGSVRGVDPDRPVLERLIAQGLCARLDMVSIITGQLYVQLNMWPGTLARQFPNDTGYPEIPSIPSLQSDLQDMFDGLITNRPKLERGLDQTLELLASMTANGGAANLARGMQAMATLAERLGDPEGPLLQALAQLPRIASEVERSLAAIPVLAQRAEAALATVDGLIGGADAPAVKALADLQATLVATRALAEQLATMVSQVRPPVVGFAQSGLPELRGLIQDANRMIGEISRTVRDIRQDPARFLLSDPAAQGVRLQ